MLKFLFYKLNQNLSTSGQCTYDNDNVFGSRHRELNSVDQRVAINFPLQNLS
jgi:hypothetical protein